MTQKPENLHSQREIKKFRNWGIRGLAILAVALCGNLFSVANTMEGNAAADGTVTGQLIALHGDGPNGEQSLDYFLKSKDDVRQVELTPEQARQAESLGAFAGNEVEISLGAGETKGIQLAKDALITAQEIHGNVPWVSLLCEFPDKPWSDVGNDKSYYQDLMASKYPGMENYWKDVSYGNINLDGSALHVYGPFILPRTTSDYYQENVWQLAVAQDCTQAAQSQVKFRDFYGINLFLSDMNSYLSYGTPGMNLVLNGQSGNWAATWIRGLHQSGILAHEEGHGFGLPHSADSLGRTYEDVLDVMGSYGTIPQHPIADHKFKVVNWIPNDRVIKIESGQMNRFPLERLANPRVDGYLVAQIPIAGSSSHYFTVEVRNPTGYDNLHYVNESIPEGVYIHEVDRNRQDPAWVMTNGQEGHWFDALRFIPGMNFTKDNFSMCVNRKLQPGKMEVVVGNGVPAACDFPLALMPASLSTVPSSAETGQQVNFTTQIDNFGVKPAADIMVTETIPMSMTFNAAGMMPNEGEILVSPDGRQIVYHNVKSIYGEPAVLTYTATIDPELIGTRVLTGSVEATKEGNYNFDGNFVIVVNGLKIYLPTMLR